MAQRDARAVHTIHRNSHWVWTFFARHERRREHGAGVPGDRPPQAEKPGEGRLRDLLVQPAVHFAGFVLRRNDHSRCGAGQVSRQPDWGLSMFLVGPVPLRLLFHGFVVLAGTLILAGAVNTSIIGSNGVLNRVAEDGVLPDWFRHPHRKFGTTHRLIDLVVILQIITILISRGDVYILGEAYAFGVMWSFFMKALSVLVLRYKRPEGREWKVPLNFRIGKA